MKILLSNKFYYPRGGDCVYTINLESLLKQHGHKVAVFAMQHPENLPSEWSKYFPSEVKFVSGKGIVESLFRPFGSREVKRKFNAMLDDFNPDVVHLNNIHSQLSPVIAQIAHESGVKVIWTLHDYKLLCPRSDCLKYNHVICEDCYDDKSNVKKHRCLKNSRIGSFIAYKEAVKWSREKLEKYTDMFICPGRFMADKMITGGYDSRKLTVLHNFMDMEKTKRDEYRKEDYYCYFGRLSNEKGLKTLIGAATRLPYKLKIIGTGQIFDEPNHPCENSNIEFSGRKQWSELKRIIGRARFSVIPSEWYENNPLSVIESLCSGTPVLGANIGGIPELLCRDDMNLLFASGSIPDLANKIKEMWNKTHGESDYEKLAINSRSRFNSRVYYENLMKIYRNEKNT